MRHATAFYLHVAPEAARAGGFRLPVFVIVFHSVKRSFPFGFPGVWGSPQNEGVGNFPPSKKPTRHSGAVLTADDTVLAQHGIICLCLQNFFPYVITTFEIAILAKARQKSSRNRRLAGWR
jgi:hypothetical protein